MRANKRMFRILGNAAFLLYLASPRCRTFQPQGNGFATEDFAREIFEAFQTKDSTAFMQRVISTDEIQNLPDQPGDGSLLKMSKAEVQQALRENRQKMPAAFTEILRLGEREFGDWQKTRYDRVEYALEKSAGIRSADYIDIYFYAGTRHYKIRLDDCLLTKRGWVMVDGPRWSGKAEPALPVK